MAPPSHSADTGDRPALAQPRPRASSLEPGLFGASKYLMRIPPTLPRGLHATPRVLLAGSLAALLGLGGQACEHRAVPGASQAPPPGAPLSATPGTQGRFACRASSDCINSCEYDAVNSEWYTWGSSELGFRECKDGCNDQLGEAPRCERGLCVAYRRDPRQAERVTPDPSCASRPLPRGSRTF